MSNYESGENLLREYDLRPFEFFNDYVKKGLQPYDNRGRPIPSPGVPAKKSLLKKLQKELKVLEHYQVRLQSHLKEMKEESYDLMSQPHWQYLVRYGEGLPPPLEEVIKESKQKIKNNEEKIKGLSEKIDTLTKELSSLHGDSWKNYSLPDSESKAKLILDSLRNMFFKKEEFLKLHDGSTIKRSSRQSPAQGVKAVFPCKSGTKWEDVKITLVDNDTVRIKTPQGEGSFVHHELKMTHKTSKKPTMLWELLVIFAQHQGFISRKNPKYDPTIPDTAKRLNRKLKDLFQINDSIYTGHYKTEGGYRTKIAFSDKTQVAS